MTEDEEILLAFLEESRENLDQLDRDLVDLEARADPELLSRVFRVVHTLKGTCGFLGFTRLESLSHAGEDLLGALRAGQLVLDRSIADSLLRLVDVTRSVLRAIETSGAEPAEEHADLIAELRAHLPADDAPTTSATAVADEDATIAPSAGSESSVRVDVGVLDRLMDLVGELVLARSRIGELVGADDEGPLAATYRELRVVTGDLQDSVMTARMQPIGVVTGKFHRIARDLAAALGKQVVVQLEGEDVGVDKAINEALRDPLLHLVRNALDHGIETPAERLAAGKPAAGLLRIRAFHEGGRVHVELSDDGRGIDAEALRDKALRSGVLSAERAAELSTEQSLDLMFHAGLSTREEVTSTSGRGVGMDVVRASLDQVGGTVDVSSTAGQGALFRLNVPLTLAIMPVLVSYVGDGRFAVPQADLREITSLTPDEVEERVDVVEQSRLLRLRGGLLPLVDLAPLLGVRSRRDDGGLAVVVVETDGRRFGIVVDEVADTVDVVVKPMPRLLRTITVFSGTTILGDGRPALLLDVAGLAAAAGIVAGSTHDDQVPAGVDLTAHAAGLLLATAPDGGRLAVRLPQVRRLESFAVGRIERTGEQEVVQYDGALLPLVRVAALLPERRQGDRAVDPDRVLEEAPTVVCETSLGPVGLVVASIDDVVPEPDAPPQPPSRRGVEACVVVAERVAEVLDVEVLAADAGIGGRT